MLVRVRPSQAPAQRSHVWLAVRKAHLQRLGLLGAAGRAAPVQRRAVHGLDGARRLVALEEFHKGDAAGCQRVLRLGQDLNTQNRLVTEAKDRDKGAQERETAREMGALEGKIAHPMTARLPAMTAAAAGRGTAASP